MEGLTCAKLVYGVAGMVENGSYGVPGLYADGNSGMVALQKT